MFLLKIINKSSFSFSSNTTVKNYAQYLFHKFKVLKFLKKEVFSFYLSWLLLFILTKWYSIKIKSFYFILRFCFLLFNKQKLIRYIININLSLSNTFINMNNINGSPKWFYSAGMFNLQKKQKIFIKFVMNYSCSSHNGCRLKKKKRIKIRTRTKKL